MKLKTMSAVALGAAAFLFSVAPTGQIGFAAAQAQTDSVRPEVGRLLKDASALIKNGKSRDALAKVREAER